MTIFPLEDYEILISKRGTSFIIRQLSSSLPLEKYVPQSNFARFFVIDARCISCLLKIFAHRRKALTYLYVCSVRTFLRDDKKMQFLKFWNINRSPSNNKRCGIIEVKYDTPEKRILLLFLHRYIVIYMRAVHTRVMRSLVFKVTMRDI